MSDTKENSKKSWLKNWFRGSSTSTSTESPPSQTNFDEEFWVSIHIFSPIEARINKLNELCTVLENNQLERSIVEKLWIETKDLLNLNLPRSFNAVYFKFLRVLIKSQYRQLGMLKPILYQDVRNLPYSHHDDILNVMLVINLLTDHGKNLCMMEHEIGLQLVRWMHHLGGNEVYLALLLNIIKFNSSYLSKDTIHGIVQHLCEHCAISTCSDEMDSLLKVLDAIICYNSLPHVCLQNVVFTLCHTLNFKVLCEQSWKLMRNLLGTHHGHSCVEIMIHLLQDKSSKNYNILRSAVSFIGMGLWGPKCVSVLMHEPQAILPSFKHALASKNMMLSFEISLTCQRLVKKFGHELHACAWDEILIILGSLLNIADQNSTEQIPSLKQNAHELLTIIEKLYQSQAFTGSPDELFRIVEQHVKSRPFESLILLISYRSLAVNPAKNDWISTLLEFIDKYYISCSITKSKLKVLDILENIIINNISVYEEELIDNVIFPKFQNFIEEQNYVVQENIIQFLLKICSHSRTNRCISLMQIMESYVEINVDFDRSNQEIVSCFECVVGGFVDLFYEKFSSDYANQAIEVFYFLLSFIESYYFSEELWKYPLVLKEIRQRIITILLELRVNSKLQITLLSKPNLDSNVICFNYEEAETKDCRKSPTSKFKSSDMVIPYQRSFSCFSQCFRKENYWPILEGAIEGVCEILHNKCLILAISPNEINFLAEALNSLISNSNRALTLSGAPPTFKRPDLMAYGLKAISVLASYHEQMTITRQRQILRCLEGGFNSKCAKQCIAATTLCIIEMKPEAFLRNLPSILLRLSQMSATVHLATAVLELLSTLAQLPELYANFVDDQYMSVFKIALQHADPRKFSLYVVSLAHHVITIWFIKCRLVFRPDFVSYISLCLQTTCRSSPESSLQHNLLEACIDVMARYTFSNGVPTSKRPEHQKNLSKNGRKATWLLGNRLITIQTDIKLEKNFEKQSSLSKLSIQESLDYNKPRDNLCVVAEKKISQEAPAKLQSSDPVSVKSARHRHKSSGAILHQNLDSQSSDRSIFYNNDLSDTFKTTTISTESGSGWAEIYIRRPSGNVSWLLNSQQLNLMLTTLSETTINELPQQHGLSYSTSDLRRNVVQDEDKSVDNIRNCHHDNETFMRQRSRTVSSSQDYMIEAANRAKTKNRENSYLARLEKHEAINLSEASIATPNERVHVLSPELIFLQLFHSAIVSDGLQCPLRLPDSATVDRSISVLDLIPSYDTWQTGVVYVRPGQSNDGKAILYNKHGSLRYQNLLSSLGTLVVLADCDPSTTYLGGLDYADGEDGEMTYVWQESTMQMVFHVATLMPNQESGVSNKQRHIGNDYVTIVYDDNNPQNYVPGSVVKGQFLSIEIVITPLDLGYNRVRLIYHKENLKKVLQLEEQYIVSDRGLGLLVRQVALHSSMASAAYLFEKTPEKFVSKALSRLKQIKHIRSRALQEIAWKDEERTRRYNSSFSSEQYSLEDFSYFVT